MMIQIPGTEICVASDAIESLTLTDDARWLIVRTKSGREYSVTRTAQKTVWEIRDCILSVLPHN